MLDFDPKRVFRPLPTNKVEEYTGIFEMAQDPKLAALFNYHAVEAMKYRQEEEKARLKKKLEQIVGGLNSRG